MLQRERYRGCLLGVLVGDGLGAPFEGAAGVVSEADIALVAGDASPLGYTDDTVMTIALAEALVRSEGFDEEDVARAFAQHWALGPERGYSSTTSGLLAGIASGTPLRQAQREQAARPSRATNGAAMRVAPAALLAAGRLPETIEIAEASARVTHSHPEAITGARIQAAAVALALSGPAADPIDRSGFVRVLRDVSNNAAFEVGLAAAAELCGSADPDEIGTRIGNGILAREAVPAAVCVFLSHSASFPDVMTLAIRLGGDTDTIGAMAGAIAGAALGEAAIPSAWIERAELSTQVRDLADCLFAAAQRRSGEG